MEDNAKLKYSEEVEEELVNVRGGSDYVLHLNYQQLQGLPKEVYDSANYGHVRRIYMKQNLVKSLPPDIGQLKNLVELYLHSNVLEELPIEVGDLENLESLDVSFNNLSTLPASVGNLKSLENLQIQHNRLQSLPPEIGQLQNLHVLDVMNNKIRCLPVEITGCSQLERLLVDRNHLSWLPTKLVEMTHLQEVSASGNQLLCLPLEVGDFENIESLDVSFNNLATLPASVENLNSLESLQIQNKENNVNKMCQEVSPLENIHLYSNEYDFKMGEMQSLKSVYVDNNPYLHAVPVGLDSQEIGFSSCGSDNYMPGMDTSNSHLLKVVIKHNETEEKTIYLPREIEVMCDNEKGPVVSLFELALRATYMFFKKAICPDDLPRDVLQLLRQPVSLCQMCRSPIFTMGHPLVFEGQIRLYSLYRLCMCCSPKCVKLASLIINLPLVYPSATTLDYAVALLEPPQPAQEVD